MINGKRVLVIMPAYNAAQTLAKTYQEIAFDIVDEVILVDDCSDDNTSEIANLLGIKHIIQHEQNKGYGANQKSCYAKAIELGADIVVMLHPDYQYTPKLIPSMVNLIGYGVYPVVIGSRILGKGALLGGMPRYKYIANRFLTLFQNIVMNQKLSEYHTGFRAFHIDVLKAIRFEKNSDDFVFDNQLLSQILFAGYQVAEITCPTRYSPEASSINFPRSLRYGLGVLQTSILYRLQRWGISVTGFNKSYFHTEPHSVKAKKSV
jgi:glycosyltransferase involved in cell wall biosynthesis